MRERLAVPLTLKEMAGLGFMSPFHFNRVFHLVTGVPPGLFQSGLRFEAAKRLLLTTEMHPEEICERLGFLSASTFARQFKAKVGVTPDGLRRLARMITEAPFTLDDFLPALPATLQAAEGVAGKVAAPEGFDGLVVVALFRKDAPEGWPVACAMLAGAGNFVLPPMADGWYHLLAAGVDRRVNIISCLVESDQILRSGSRGVEVVIDQGRILGLPEPCLRLRPADPADPPILFAFPALIMEPLLGSDDTARDEGQLVSVQAG
jgi:AraC family transcriptional regulator